MSDNHWNLPQIIDLGTLPPKQPVKRPILVGVPGPVRFRSELAGLQVIPTQLTTPGEHLIQLTLPGDILNHDTMLAGSLIIDVDNVDNNEQQTISIIGWVATDNSVIKATSGIQIEPVILDFGQIDGSSSLKSFVITIQLRNHNQTDWQGRLQAMVPWLTLDRLIVHCSAGEESQFTARLNRDVHQLPTGVTNVIQALKINGGEQDLSIGATISCLDAPVHVEESTPKGGTLKVPSLGADVSSGPSGGQLLDFGEIELPTTNLQAREIRLSSLYTKPIEGWVHSTIPWLEVEPAIFWQHPGQETVIQVRLTKEVHRLKPNIYDVAGAVVLHSGNSQQMIRAKVQVSHQTSYQTQLPNKSQSPYFLDFGQLSNMSDPLPSQDIQIQNRASKQIQATAQSTVPWLKVTPTKFTWQPSEVITLTVQLTPVAHQFHARVYNVDGAIIIEAGGERYLVTARLEVVKYR
jgi:hypothetical protein